MQIPLVEKFLFCISLETGGQILGWFSGIGAIVGLLVSVFLFGFAAINYEQLLNATISDNKEMLQLLDKAQYCMLQRMIHQCEKFTPNLRSSRRAGAFLDGRVQRIFALCECSTDKKREKCLNPVLHRQ